MLFGMRKPNAFLVVSFALRASRQAENTPCHPPASSLKMPAVELTDPKLCGRVVVLNGEIIATWRLPWLAAPVRRVATGRRASRCSAGASRAHRETTATLAAAWFVLAALSRGITIATPGGPTLILTESSCAPACSAALIWPPDPPDPAVRLFCLLPEPLPTRGSVCFGAADFSLGWPTRSPNPSTQDSTCLRSPLACPVFCCCNPASSIFAPA